jgi:hypothetical protein
LIKVSGTRQWEAQELRGLRREKFVLVAAKKQEVAKLERRITCFIRPAAGEAVERKTV